MSEVSSVTTAEQVEERARERGLVVRYPAPNELFVDIDSLEQLYLHNQLFSIFEEMEPGIVAHRTASPSGKPGRFHVVVVLPRDVRDEAERLMLQAFLGSDPKRELLGYRHLTEGAELKRCNCFFEKPALTESEVRRG